MVKSSRPSIDKCGVPIDVYRLNSNLFMRPASGRRRRGRGCIARAACLPELTEGL